METQMEMFFNGSISEYDVLTAKERNAQNALNAKNGYGINAKMLLRLAQNHKKARAANDVKTVAKIEYRLTDINFHHECSLLHRGEYGTVYRICAEW